MSAGHVYVIAFDNGIVKVGRTQNAPNRLRAHKSDGRKFGIAIANSWTSPLHVEWEINEETLKRIATKNGGTTIGPEYFRGADYAAIVTEASALPFTPSVTEIAAGPRCRRAGRTVRECATRVAALEAQAYATADNARIKVWEDFKAGACCGRCIKQLEAAKAA